MIFLIASYCDRQKINIKNTLNNKKKLNNPMMECGGMCKDPKDTVQRKINPKRQLIKEGAQTHL